MRILRVLILIEDSADKETETTLTYAFQHFLSEREIHGKVVEVVRDTEQEKVSRIGYSENTVHFEEYVCDPTDDESDYEFTCKNETDGPLTGNMTLVTCPNCLTRTNPRLEDSLVQFRCHKEDPVMKWSEVVWVSDPDIPREMWWGCCPTDGMGTEMWEIVGKEESDGDN